MGTRCKMMSTPENTRKTQKFGPSFFPAEILYKGFERIGQIVTVIT